MNTFGTFLYESGISIAVFYFFYRMFLHRETWFSMNRIILMATMMLSLTIPFIRISFHGAPEPGTIYYVLDRYVMDNVVVHPENAATAGHLQLSFGKMILLIYLAGVLFLSIKFFMQLAQILRMKRHYGILDFEGYRIVPVNKNLAPFSFFTLIFINPDELGKDEMRNILKHEWEHIRRFHTLDIILLEIICIIQWFNPFVWLYKYTMRELHEYEADLGVVHNGENRLSYQKIIVQQAFGNQFFPMVHSWFKHSFTKKRILMLTRHSGKTTLLKSLLIFPLAAVLVLIFSFTREPDNLSSLKQVFDNSKMPDMAGNNFVPPIAGLQGTTVTSGYGMRIHPETKSRQFHSGVDIKAPGGTPVLAVADGTVSRAKPNGKFGNEVGILHAGNLESRYDHLDQIKVTKGQKIKQGEIIGTVGNTGVTNQPPHLHFAMLRNGEFVNPATYIHFREIQGDQTTILNIRRTKPDNAGSKNKEDVLQEQDTTQGQIFFKVEEMPKFRGGDENTFYEWIADNLRYPGEAKQKGIGGKVFIRFIVEADGRVSNVDVIRSADPLLDAEAVRVVQSSPPWTPGKQRGKKVRVAYTFPIVFSLQKENTSSKSETNEKNVTGTKDKDELFLEDIPQVQEKLSVSETFFIVEEMPKFQGGDIGKFRQYIADHVQYPETAVKRGISGKVFVQWVVDENGNVTNVKVVRGVDPDLDTEAIRVVKSSPVWTPGRQRGVAVRVQMTTPIVFVLDHGKESESGVHYQKPGQKILYFIDGRKATEEEVKILNADSIKNISILNGIEAEWKYGEEAKDGVIFITTKIPVPVREIKPPAPPENPFEKSARYLYMINGKASNWETAQQYKNRRDVTITIHTMNDRIAKKIFGKKAKNGVVFIEEKNK